MSAIWDHELVIREHEMVDPAGMADDPAEFAVEQGLVGRHDSVEVRKLIGAWRWHGLSDHRQRIVEILRTGGPAIDFGGGAAPVGYGATVVDYFSTYRAPYDVPGEISTVFTSHTLEHIPDLVCLMGCLSHRISRPGHLIAFVPSWRMTNLQAEVFPHHCHTFYLSKEKESEPIKERWVPFDSMLKLAGMLELVTYTQEGCLLGIVRVD